MSSLFQDGDCGCYGGKKDVGNSTKCKGCVCELLSQLDKQSIGDICDMGSRQQLLIKQKGTAMPVSLDGTGTPTVFTLERFDYDSCCAVFSFDGTSSTGTVRRTFIEDCRSIAGIVCLGNNNTTTTV